MSEPEPSTTSAQSVSKAQTAAHTHASRGQLLWTLLVFQLKLLTDGLRDLVLSPLSFFAVLVGIVAGGHEPDRLFRRLLLWGKRSERWINLFGQRPDAGTADELLSPLKDRTFAEAQNSELVQKLGGNLNGQLDRLNSELSERRRPKS